MDILLKYFPQLTSRQQEQFAQLMPLYGDWNAKINVISRKDLEHLYLHHVLHSLAIAGVQEFGKGVRILDVGTGGGFPGIPLAIMFPEAEFLLIDSIGKKIKVVEAVAEAVGLRNVKAAHQRVQEVKSSFDYVVSRAVTALPAFAAMAAPCLRPRQDGAGGILYLKGGDMQEELAALRRTYRIHPISNLYSEEYFAEKYVVHIFQEGTTF